MAQVQLYLTKTQRGYASVGNINPSEDIASHIHDFSDALEALRFDAALPQVFYLISYVSEGLLLTLLRPLEGDGTNAFAASMFFQHGMRIEPRQIMALIDVLRPEVLKAETPSAETMAELRRLLSADYPIDPSAPRYLNSTGDNYAVARIGGEYPSLGAIADEHFYQPRFSDFAGVVLFDANGDAIPHRDVADLSGKLCKIYTILPPHNTPEGFVPHIAGKPFRHPLLAGKDTVIDLSWRRSGFKTVRQQIIVNADNMTFAPCDTSSARKIITKASFSITEQNTRKPVDDFEVKVNGETIDGPATLLYKELTNAAVEITAPGYFPYSGTFDLAATTKALIQLRKLHKTYRFDIPLQTQETLAPAQVYVETMKPLSSCPIEGYRLVDNQIIEGGGPNTVRYIGGTGRISYHILASIGLGALLIGIVLGSVIFGEHKHSDVKPAPVPDVETVAQTPENSTPAVEEIPETTVPAPAEEKSVPATTPESSQPEAPATDFSAAKSYLDSNKDWIKADMEQIAALQGLFDDLNTYNFDRIKNYWAEKLNGSKNFEAVMRAVNGSATKRHPRVTPHSPTYTTNEKIVWRSYTYWIDP